MKKILLLSLMTFSMTMAHTTAYANQENKAEKKAEMKAKIAAHKSEIHQACQADAETAGCADKEVGTGLMKCLAEYKKANKDFQISEGCKTASKNMRKEKKSWKLKKEAEKLEKDYK